MNRKRITEEFEQIKKAPLSIIISVLILSAIVFAFLDKYVYKTEIQNLNSKIDLLNTQISIYKGKTFVLGETEYSKMPNSKLKQRAKNKLNLIKSQYKEYKALDTLRNKYSSLEESNKFFDLQSSKVSQMIVDYELNHKAEMILLREQMLLRLPKEYIKSSSIDRYIHVVNPLGYKEIINDFEKLVLNLPSE